MYLVCISAVRSTGASLPVGEDPWRLQCRSSTFRRDVVCTKAEVWGGPGCL